MSAVGLENKNVLMVIAPEGFRDEEYAQPRAALYASGANIVTASTHAGKCRGMLDSIVHADCTLEDAAKRAWDLAVFVGGSGAEVYFDDPTAQRIARDTLHAGKPVSAICIAPSILAHAGLLDGVEATAWEGQESDLRAHGAKWTGAAVEGGQDENGTSIITANGPRAAFAFGQTLVGVLSAGDSAGETEGQSACCTRPQSRK